MSELTPNLLIIILGIFHIILYIFICWRKNKPAKLLNSLEHFLNGFIPYAVYESITGSLAGKNIPDDHLKVLLIVAGLSLIWLYYHIMKRLLTENN